MAVEFVIPTTEATVSAYRIGVMDGIAGHDSREAQHPEADQSSYHWGFDYGAMRLRHGVDCRNCTDGHTHDEHCDIKVEPCPKCGESAVLEYQLCVTCWKSAVAELAQRR